MVALLVRGDHELNAVKAQKLPGVANPLRMSSNDTIAQATGAEAGFLGPVGFKGKIYADHSVARARATSSAAPTRRTRTSPA